MISDVVMNPIQSNPKPNPKKEKEKATLPQEVTDFSRSFYEYLTQNGGKKEYTDGEINKGAAEVDKLIRLDKYDLETEIKPALQWGLKDSFWSGQIRSLSQLRKKSKSNDEKKFTNLFNQFSARDVVQTTKNGNKSCERCDYRAHCSEEKKKGKGFGKLCDSCVVKGVARG